MKIEVKELKPNPKESEEYKQGNLYQHIILFEGEVECFQFRAHDSNIAVPNFIRQNNEGTVLIVYPYPSNVRCVLEDDTLWVYPAITEQELKVLKENRDKEGTIRKENLATITSD